MLDRNVEQNSAAGAAPEPKRPYSPPAIIYTTIIMTRAGSPLSVDDSSARSIDPMDLFDE